MSEASQRPSENEPVKMRGFGKRSSVDEAWAWLDGQVQALNAETVPLVTAAGRVLACDVSSDVDVPGFERAMMDGFAVKSADTAGAGPYNRLALEIVGESLPGIGHAGE